MTKRLFALLLALCTLVSAAGCHKAEPSETSSEVKEEISSLLNENWLLSRVPDVSEKGESISTAAFAPSEAWIAATVPGTVLTSYYNAGKIDDPYYGDNMEKLSQEYYNVDYWYRTEFAVPEAYRNKRLWLNFDGINWKARVYLNGVKVGDINGAFIRGRFDITETVDFTGKNTLAVYIEWCDSQTEDMPSFLCSASWDWMPAIPGRNMGIYKDVFLSATGDVTVNDVNVVTDLPLPDTSKATLTASAFVKNVSDKEITGQLKGKISYEEQTYSLEKTVTVKAGEETEVFFEPLTVENPALWWPNGSGEQPLYELAVSFEENGAVSDTETISFGIREISYDYTEGDLTLSVNGQKILCKGGNWGIPDAMLRFTDEDFDDAVRLHAEENFNMIRCWHGTSDFAAFYEACDRYGILVYEDFWLNGWSSPRDVEMFMQNVDDKVRRLRSHACLAVWCGENEATPPAPLDKLIPETIEKYDTERLYIAASNDGAVAGGVTYAIQDPAWYFKHTVGFTTEIGLPTVPTAESMRRMMDEEDLWPVGNSVWSLHDWNFGIGNKLVETYQKAINARYGAARNIDDFCKKAQLLNYESYKAIFEAWNDTVFEKTSGVLLWMSTPAWPSTIWQTYDYYKDATGGYYGCKVACESVHIQWNCLTGSVKAINLTASDIPEATAEITVYNSDGSVPYRKSAVLTAKANSATEITKLLGIDGGTDLAHGKTVTCSSQSEEFTARNAVDGSSETRWAAEKTGKQWLCVDLGKEESIDRVCVEWENAFASGYQIQVSSDGVNFTSVCKVNNGDGGIDTLSFDPVNARYVRVLCTAAGTMWAYSILELRVIKAGSMGESLSGLSDTHFIQLKLFDKENNLLSENFYWRGQNSSDYTAMEKMKTAEISSSALRTDTEETTVLTVTLTNESDVCAVCLRLKLQKSFIYEGDGDSRVLPTFYEDNYFSLAPHESRTVKITFDTADLNGAEPLLSVEGYNVPTGAVTIF